MIDPVVGVVMGSRSDWPVMEHASLTLVELGIVHETKVISAHRTPDRMIEYAQSALDRGLRCIIAGAGGAAHLPGMLACQTIVPVLGVPVSSTALSGIDSLLSIVQMPAGYPVATFAIGKPGAINAALFAAMLVSIEDVELKNKLLARRFAAFSAVVESQSDLPFP